MIKGQLINILNEIKNLKIKKNKIIEELFEKFQEFSKNVDELYDNFDNYISSIENRDIINDEISNNIRAHRTKIINKIKNFKNKKIFELIKFFNENISFNKINELIDDVIEIKINIYENEKENISFDKPIDKSYSKFYEDFINSEKSNTLSTEKQKKDSEINIINTNNNIIKEILKCYECKKEGTIQCTNKECCNFIFCKNCSEINYKNDVKISHNLKIFDNEECKSKEIKKEKFLDLISEIFTSFFIIINCLLEKEKFPSFPDIKDKNWKKNY